MNQKELKKIEENFSRRIKKITDMELKIPESYVEMCNTVRKTYLEMCEDIFERLKRDNQILHKSISQKEIREFCTGHYFFETDEDEEVARWQPFEDEEDYKIEEYIENDIHSLTSFLEEHGVLIKDEIQE